MKSKFASIIMFFIIIAIILTFGVLGFIVWQELNESTSEESINVAENQNEFLNDIYIEPNLDVEESIKNTNIIEIHNNVTDSSSAFDKLKQNNNQNQELKNNENAITINKHFYRQLNSYSQMMYRAFEKNRENMKTGTYKIELGSSFSNILKQENGQEELGKYFQSAIEAYTYDNPWMFYIDPNKMCLNVETTTKGNSKTFNTFIDSGEDTNYLIKEFSSKAEVDDAINQLENVKKQLLSKKTGNTYKDVKMLHDYLIKNIEYDATVSEPNIYDIYGGLIRRKCVCEGYAKSLKYLLDAFGIESTLVIGTGDNSNGQREKHAWNYVKVDDIWYAIDVTWDDPVIVGNSINIDSDIYYKFFLKGLKTMNVNHFPSNKFTDDGMEFQYPIVSNNDYE